MAEAINESPTFHRTLGTVVRSAIGDSVRSYFFPLTFVLRHSRQVYKWALPFLMTVLPSREETELDSSSLQNREEALEEALNDALKEALEKKLNQEIARKEKLEREQNVAREQLSMLEISHARAETTAREQEMEQELQQKRVRARERVRALRQALEEAAELEDALRRELALKQPYRWGLEQALEWTQKQVLELNQQHERERELIRELEQALRVNILDENAALRLNIEIRLQNRSLREWERQLLEAGLEEDRLVRPGRKQELTPDLKKYVKRDLQRAKSREKQLTQSLEQMQARIATLEWGLARALKSD
jgi:hypothetical protein